MTPKTQDMCDHACMQPLYIIYTRNNEHIGFHVKHISKASKVLTRLM